MVIFLTAYSGVFSLSMTSHLFSPHTIIPAPEENSQQANDWKVLCSGLLVEPVGADRQGHLRTGAFKTKQDTLGVCCHGYSRELALTHHTFKAGRHTSPWE